MAVDCIVLPLPLPNPSSLGTIPGQEEGLSRTALAFLQELEVDWFPNPPP